MSPLSFWPWMCFKCATATAPSKRTPLSSELLVSSLLLLCCSDRGSSSPLVLLVLSLALFALQEEDTCLLSRRTCLHNLATHGISDMHRLQGLTSPGSPDNFECWIPSTRALQTEQIIDITAHTKKSRQTRYHDTCDIKEQSTTLMSSATPEPNLWITSQTPGIYFSVTSALLYMPMTFFYSRQLLMQRSAV